MSDYDPESELSRLARSAGGAPVPVSTDLFDVLERSQEMYKRSNGAFTYLFLKAVGEDPTRTRSQLLSEVTGEKP